MVVTQLNPVLSGIGNNTYNSIGYPTGGFYEDDSSSNGGGFDNVVDKLNDSLSVYERLRCAIKPSAPGCYSESSASGNGNNPDGEQNQIMLIIGVGVLVLLAIVVVVIALKK